MCIDFATLARFAQLHTRYTAMGTPVPLDTYGRTKVQIISNIILHRKILDCPNVKLL